MSGRTKPKANRAERAVLDVEAALAVLDDQRLDVAAAWIAERFPGSPAESVRRSVAIVHRALIELLAEPFMGRRPDPGAFRMPAEAVARRVRDLSPSGVRFVAPDEVSVCVDALVAAAGVFAILEPGDPTAPTPKRRAPLLSLVAARSGLAGAVDGAK